MSEAISEMVIPGTYIEVRAEGLIGVGAIATGNIGIIGTAARGVPNAVRALGSYPEAIDQFGLADAFEAPIEAGAPLTLTRALEQAFAGGARNVFAVRAANEDPDALTAATLPVRAAGDQPGFTLTAGPPDPENPRNPLPGGAGTWGRDVNVAVTSETAGAETTWKLTIEYRNIREVYEGVNVGAIHARLANSSLVTAGPVANETSGFDLLEANLVGGTNGAVASTVDLAAALAMLEDQDVNLVLVAGGSADVVGNMLLAHLERTENAGRERIAVVGAQASGSVSAAAGVEADAAAFSDDRLVLCAPGMVTTDGATGRSVTLGPAYTAAVVAGKLATLAPHISLTNKTLPITPDVRYSSALTQRLLLQRVLLVRQKYGAQVVKAVTTSAKPFDQISIRRTVDFAKAGVRSGSDPYIGRLNNPRVRAALKATLDGFLSQMVLDEMLTDYSLDVTATRAQEINGIAAVVMTLKPTFSIDFVRVTMNLE